MTFFHCRSSGIHMLCAFLPPSADVVFHNGSSRKDLLFYLATNGIWKSAAATYLHVCQALREPFVHSFRGECEVKQSAAGQLWVTECLRTTQGLFSGSLRTWFKCCHIFVSEECDKSTASQAFDINCQWTSILQLCIRSWYNAIVIQVISSLLKLLHLTITSLVWKLSWFHKKWRFLQQQQMFV